MRIILINPATVGYSRSVTTPLGLLSIASCLQAEGHKVRLYDRTVEKVKMETVFKEFSPDLVGVSLVSFKSVHDALAVSEYAKKTLTSRCLGWTSGLRNSSGSSQKLLR